MQPSHISILDRGIVLAYPHLRGSKELSTEQYEEGLRDRRLTHYCDFIDAIKLFVNKDISKNILALGEGPLGALTVLITLIQAPELLKAAVIHVASLLMLDIYLERSL